MIIDKLIEEKKKWIEMMIFVLVFRWNFDTGADRGFEMGVGRRAAAVFAAAGDVLPQTSALTAAAFQCQDWASQKWRLRQDSHHGFIPVSQPASLLQQLPFPVYSSFNPSWRWVQSNYFKNNLSFCWFHWFILFLMNYIKCLYHLTYL